MFVSHAAPTTHVRQTSLRAQAKQSMLCSTMHGLLRNTNPALKHVSLCFAVDIPVRFGIIMVIQAIVILILI